MVPRFIHRVWLGAEPLPEQFKHYGDTWRRHHPDWDLQLWTDSNLPRLRHPEVLDRCDDAREASAHVRNELLARLGGVYVDVDVECKRSIESLVEGADAFAAWERPGRVGGAVLGAVPGHPAIERLLSQTAERAGRGGNDGTQASLLTDVLSGTSEVTLLDAEAFYAYDPGEREDDGRFPVVYAIHHGGVTWTEPQELLGQVHDLSEEVEALAARNEELVEMRDRLRRELERARARGERLDRQLERKDRRLNAIQGSRWWRARRSLARKLGPARPLARRVRRGVRRS